MKPVQLSQLEITDNFVYVSSEQTATTYAYERRVEIPDPKSVMKLINEIIRLSRSKGIKIKNQAKAKQAIKALTPLIPSLTIKYNQLFDEHKAFWEQYVNFDKKIIENYDCEQTEPIYELRNKCRAMFYRSEPLSQLCERKMHLDEVLAKVKESSGGNSTYALF